jgi:hypothetical protein
VTTSLPTAQVIQIVPAKPTTGPGSPKRKPGPWMVPWKLVWVAAGMLGTAVLAVVLSLVSLFVAVVTVVVLIVAVRGAAWWLMTGAMVLVDVPKDTTRAYVNAITAGAVIHSGLVIAARDLDPVVAGGILWGLGILEYSVALAAGYLNGRRKAVPRPDLDKTGQIITAALRKAGFGQLRVVRWSPLQEPGEAPCGVSVVVQLSAGGGALPVNAAELIGVALAEILKCPLRSDWVELISMPGVGEYELNVTFKETMAGVIPYQDDPRWRSIKDPALVGYAKNRTPTYLTLAQHGEDIGKTRYGKSSLINTKLAHLTLCRDAVVWVAGAEKLYDLVAGWVEPYNDTDHPLPFDWIATGQVDVLEVLIAGMNVARWRQRQPLDTRVGWPHLVIVLDEASFALRNRTPGVYQGQRVTASQMAAMISQGAGSANVWLQRATQRSTNDHSGDHGGDVGANVGFSTAFASKDWAEVGRLMGDFQLPMPTQKGQFWLYSDEHEQPIKLKAPYIQEVDPSKPKLHDGATVSDIAWARREFVRTLDPGSATAAGPVYARRHVRMNEAMRTYLTGEPQVPTAPSGPAMDGYLAVKAALAALESGSVEQGSVTELTPRRTRADRIVDIVTEAARPLSPTEIVAALRESGDAEAGEQVVTNALTKLVGDNRLQRPERGLYIAG